MESKQQGWPGDLMEPPVAKSMRKATIKQKSPWPQIGQNGIGEELLPERQIPGIANNQATKHRSNASPGSSHTNCGCPSTDKLGSCVKVPGNNTGLESGHLERGAAAGRLVRWGLCSTQEEGRHRPD